MSALNLAGNFSCYLGSIVPGGAGDVRLLCADIGGGLLRAWELYGQTGMTMGQLDNTPGSEIPSAALSALPAGFRPSVAPEEPHKWALDTPSDPGGPSDALTDASDGFLMRANLEVPKTEPSYQFLEDWAGAFGGEWSALP